MEHLTWLIAAPGVPVHTVCTYWFTGICPWCIPGDGSAQFLLPQPTEFQITLHCHLLDINIFEILFTLNSWNWKFLIHLSDNGCVADPGREREWWPRIIFREIFSGILMDGSDNRSFPAAHRVKRLAMNIRAIPQCTENINIKHHLECPVKI